MHEDLFRRAWGKLDQEPDGSRRLLALSAHCADVAAVAWRLLELPVWRNRIERLAERSLEPFDLARLGALAYLHDLGKCASGFWLKQLDVRTPEGRPDVSERLERLKALGGDLSECGHTSVIGALLRDGPANERFRDHALVQALFREDFHVELLIASASHHGTPVNRSCSVPSWVWRPVPALEYDPLRELERLLDQAAAIFPDALRSGPGLPENDEFVHAFCGVVSLADWIGSNPALDFFPYDLAPPESRWPAARARAARVLRSMRIDCSDAVEELERRSPGFGEVFRDRDGRPWEPTSVQQVMSDPDLGPLVVIEDETGAGKTEAALWRFKALLEAGEVDSLAFVLPTRVSAVALSERIEKFLQSLFPDPDLRPNSVLAVPGYLVSDGLEGQKLARFEVLWPDRDEEASAHRHWAAEHTKRYLAAAVAVGTVDQALLAGLQSRHAHLRGAALLRSLLVVDEVHASDVYMSRILEELITRQVRSGGHVLLLSATLGHSARQRLLHCHLGRRRRLLALREDDSEGTEVPYPAVIDQGRARECRPSSSPKRVALDLAPVASDPGAIARRALAAAAQGARVLVVRNTVADAIAVQHALESEDPTDEAMFTCNGLACPHHGRFAAADRKLLDRRVEELFGKSSGPGPRILVGTQTLEQSLDIDADILLTDLCPMDVLLQRIGRLHRHSNRRRPEGFEAARLVVLHPLVRDLSGFLQPRRGQNFGLGTVYGNLLSVEATWRALEDSQTLEIPAQNRVLVENTTDYDRLGRLASDLGPAWQEKWNALMGVSGAQAQEAEAVLLNWQRPFEPFADRRQARTRLGEMPHLLRIPETQSPFGTSLSELQIPHFLWPQDSKVESIDAVDVGRLEYGFEFRIEETGFVYSRHGLERHQKTGSESPKRHHAETLD